MQDLRKGLTAIQAIHDSSSVCLTYPFYPMALGEFEFMLPTWLASQTFAAALQTCAAIHEQRFMRSRIEGVRRSNSEPIRARAVVRLFGFEPCSTRRGNLWWPSRLQRIVAPLQD